MDLRNVECQFAFFQYHDIFNFIPYLLIGNAEVLVTRDVSVRRDSIVMANGYPIDVDICRKTERCIIANSQFGNLVIDSVLD